LTVVNESPSAVLPARPAASRVLRQWLGGIRLAYVPVLVTYFCFGASAVASIALVYFEKDALVLSPAEAAAVAFWVGLPWSMKMVVGVASDAYPILGSRRGAYLLLGALSSLAGYVALATTVRSRGMYLAASVLVAVGFMVQDVVADALSVEIAETDEELGQIQTLGRMALLAGSISVGYLSGVLAARLGTRGTFAVAALLPLIVILTLPLVRGRRHPERAPAPTVGPLAGGNARLILLVGLAYAALGVLLESLDVPLSRELTLIVSAGLIGLLLHRVGISRGVAVAAIVIFLFRATPSVGQGYSYWAIDRLGFDQQFLGLLAQVSSVLGLAGLLVFRKTIVKRSVSFTLVWVMIAGAVLYLPNIGLFYGLHEWLGISPHALAFIDTTISAPLAQLAMVPMLILIAKSVPPGGEATMFAIMASWMNLALSASQLFTEYLNETFAVTQSDYSRLGQLMITVGVLSLVPLLAMPLLRREERRSVERRPADSAVAPPAA
jgi:MFS family permease